MPRFRRLVCACGAPLRPSGKNCSACHAAWMRANRKPLVGDARARANARSYLNVYVRRGKVIKGPCAVCGAAEVRARIRDYTKPLDVVWLCRAHHALAT